VSGSGFIISETYFDLPGVRHTPREILDEVRLLLDFTLASSDIEVGDSPRYRDIFNRNETIARGVELVLPNGVKIRAEISLPAETSVGKRYHVALVQDN
jgi:hypothetical protein